MKTRSHPKRSTGGLRSLAVLLLSLFMLVGAGRAQAELLSPAVQHFPLIFADNGGSLSYDAGGGVLRVDAFPVFIKPSAAASAAFITPGMLELVAGVNNAGVLSSGTFVLTGAVDLDGAPISGTLLQGNVVDFGFRDSGTPTDTFDFFVEPTGGLLALLYPGQNLYVRVSAENSNFTGSFKESFQANPAKVNVLGTTGAGCSLSVDKKCAVPLSAPAPDFTCTKPIDELSMIWNGGQDIRVKAWKGTVGSTLVADVDGILSGDPVTIAGFAGSPNDIIWEIFAAGTSTKIGESKFHLSCSDADMNSADDCGKAEGNGKANESGLVNDWIFAGMADLAGSATGTLQCTPPEPPPATDTCQIPSGQDLQCTKRPTAISFRYTGGNCASSLQNQPSDKFSCSDGPAVGAAPVRILMGKDGGGNISLDTGVANVPVGGVVTATAANAGRSDFDSQSMAALTDSGGAVVQALRIRTSCSKPLRLGDRFGSLEVVGFENPEQGKVQLGSEVKFSYKVTNTGSVALPVITVDDDKLSPTAVPGSPIALGAGQSKTLTATRFVTGPQTNTVTVEATVPGTGQMCRAQDSVTITTKQPPPCEVDPGEFKLEDDKVRWKLSNGGTKVATIKSVSIHWPAGFGDLKKVKFAGDIFKDATRPPTSTVLTGSAFTGDLKNRQVKPGDTKELVFEFSKKFKGAIQGDISITVDFAEGCSVTFVPGAGPWSCVKPIDTLSMRWNGLAPIRVKAWKGTVGSTLLGDVDNVVTSQVVTVSGYAGSPNDVIWELFAAGTSSKIGESKFHLSCSDADMNSADDCGKAEGDGKSNESGLVNDWLLEGLVDAAGPLQCTP